MKAFMEFKSKSLYLSVIYRKFTVAQNQITSNTFIVIGHLYNEILSAAPSWDKTITDEHEIYK